MEILIDLMGRSNRVGKRDVSVAVATLGCIYIRSRERTVIVTLQPKVVHPLTVAAAAYKISDLRPERTIVIAGIVQQECWVFTQLMPALKKMASLASDSKEAPAVTAASPHQV